MGLGIFSRTIQRLRFTTISFSRFKSTWFAQSKKHTVCAKTQRKCEHWVLWFFENFANENSPKYKFSFKMALLGLSCLGLYRSDAESLTPLNWLTHSQYYRKCRETQEDHNPQLLRYQDANFSNFHFCANFDIRNP